MAKKPSKRKQAKPARGTKRDSHRVRAAKPDKTDVQAPIADVAPAGAKTADDVLAAAAATEARILEVLANPDTLPLTITQKADLAGVSRSTWFRHLAAPGFRARAARASRDAIGDQLGNVLDSLAKSALILGKDGHPDRKLFLEMLGEYEPPAVRSKIEIADEQKDKKPCAHMSDEELLAAFAGREALMPAGVLRRLGKDPDQEKKPNGKRKAR